MVAMSVLLGVVIWAIDAVFYYVWFYKGERSFLALLFLGTYEHKIYTRIIELLFFIMFGVFISWNMARRRKAEDELRKANDRLETRVAGATKELKITIDQLEFELNERRKAEEACQLERDKLKCILDSMRDGMCIVNQQRDINYINPVIENEFGPVEGRKCHDYFNALEEVCSNCRDTSSEMKVRREWRSLKTGKVYDISDTQIVDAEGKTSQLKVFHDITERRLKEDVLKESEKQIRYISSQILTGQEMERRRISRDVHSELGGGWQPLNSN